MFNPSRPTTTYNNPGTKVTYRNQYGEFWAVTLVDGQVKDGKTLVRYGFFGLFRTAMVAVDQISQEYSKI